MIPDTGFLFETAETFFLNLASLRPHFPTDLVAQGSAGGIFFNTGDEYCNHAGEIPI